MAIAKKRKRKHVGSDFEDFLREEGRLEDATAVSLKRLLACTACMKSIVTLNSRGVITLPAKLREAAGLKADDLLIAETTAEGILLRPAVTPPVESYSAKRVREFDAAQAELARVLPRKSSRTR